MIDRTSDRWCNLEVAMFHTFYRGTTKTEDITVRISGLIRFLEKTRKKSLGAVVNNLTCVCILFATEKEHISGVNITVHVTDLLFYVAMVRLRVAPTLIFFRVMSKNGFVWMRNGHQQIFRVMTSSWGQLRSN